MPFSHYTIRSAVQGGLGSEAAAKVGYHTPDEFLAELQKLAKAAEAPPASAPMAKTDPSSRKTHLENETRNQKGRLIS